jgi:hypothetical protein
MLGINRWAHSASIEVDAPASQVFDFLADGLKQSHWALGSVDRRALEDGLFAGVSSFDGSELYIRLSAHPDLLLVDYYVGTTPSGLRRLVEARIVPAEELGRDPARSVVTLTTWRDDHTSDEEWDRTLYVWNTEVHLIKGAVERGL